MNRKFFVSIVSFISITAMLMSGCIKAGTVKQPDTASEESELLRGMYFDASWNVIDDGADEIVLQKGDEITRKKLDGEAIESYSLDEASIEELDYGWKRVHDNGDFDVYIPYFDDVFRRSITDSQGKTTYDDGYVIMENGTMRFYDYDNKPYAEDAQYEYKDGKFIWNNQAENISFFDCGFSCKDDDGNTYTYTRWFDGEWYYEEGGAFKAFSIHNGVSISSSKDATDTAYIWFSDNQRGCAYSTETYVFDMDKVVFGENSYALVDKDGNEYANDALLCGKWHISGGTQNDGTKLTKKEIKDSTFGFTFNADGTGVETVESEAFQIRYKYDVATRELTITYTDRDAEPQTLKLDKKLSKLKWDYVNPEFPDYVGESYTFTRVS